MCLPVSYNNATHLKAAKLNSEFWNWILRIMNCISCSLHIHSPISKICPYIYIICWYKKYKHNFQFIKFWKTENGCACDSFFKKSLSWGNNIINLLPGGKKDCFFLLLIISCYYKTKVSNCSKPNYSFMPWLTSLLWIFLWRLLTESKLQRDMQ